MTTATRTTTSISTTVYPNPYYTTTTTTTTTTITTNTNTNTNIQFVFAIGLEGVGHHYLVVLMNESPAAYKYHKYIHPHGKKNAYEITRNEFHKLLKSNLA